MAAIYSNLINWTEGKRWSKVGIRSEITSVFAIKSSDSFDDGHHGDLLRQYLVQFLAVVFFFFIICQTIIHKETLTSFLEFSYSN